jgi:hypothetical protein
MARIRTVKPEFWADEKVSRLPRDARLMLIGMFNFADDEGRLRGSPLLIRSQVFPYDSDVDSESLLRALDESSLIVRYNVGDESLIWIRNFTKHQKIDRPAKSALPAPPNPSTKSRRKIDEESSSKTRALTEGSTTEGNGREGKGEEGKGMEILAPPEKPEAPTKASWDSYSAAYEYRHKEPPPDNATQRSLLMRLLKLMPRDDLPGVVAFYVAHNDAQYVRNKHPLVLLVRDYSKLHTEWKQQRPVTGTEARQIEKTQAGLDGWEGVRRAK